MARLAMMMFIVACAINSVISYSDCGSQDGTVTAVKVKDCDNDARCILKRGANTTIQIEFESGVNSDEIKAIVHGIVMDIPMPFNLPNSNGCVDSGITCPISSGTKYTYIASLPVLEQYPKIAVDVKWELQDKDGKDIVCVEIPAKLE